MTELTGNTRFRTNWRGKLILQVECNREHHCSHTMDSTPYLAWRDARLSDMNIVFAEPNEPKKVMV